ncbi:tetratricopeptide repeat-containing sulfotransferase family protein [Tahibacter caeni]|uniref:tetratricopeptide repeat-containing sulfotransferase family protein n=1 Tax=Tahibacter caeni TaxID=1453545 RepID=UPI00214757F3|nr:tetratricopeptide repeat-containing sulfotransferase family protein [Tahibacter caeni]
MLPTGFDALQNGNPAYAEQISRQLLMQNPRNEGALVLLALSLDSQGRDGEAVATFERITELAPQTPEYWVNLGNSRRRLGENGKASEAYHRALGLNPQMPDALQNLGLIQFDKGLFLGARRYLLDALALQPTDPALRSQAAAACYEAGNNEQAEELLAGWLQWAGHDLHVLVDLASLHNEMGDLEAAEQALRLAERLDPGNVRVLTRRAAFLERSNRVDEARELIAQIRRDDARNAGLLEDLDIAAANIAARGNDIDEACRLHEALLTDPVIANRRLDLFFSLGRLNDKRGRHDEAMHWLQQGHERQLSQLAQAAPELLSAEGAPMRLAQNRVQPDGYAEWRWPGAPSAEESPIFVVGFPRSGTTLLETMLDAHERLTCMDERAFLNDLTKMVEADGIDYPHGLGRLDEMRCGELRASYWKSVRAQTSADPGKWLIDKNPLNMMRLPLIARLFPRAKVILCVRDPRDVVLSNYMQIFRAPGYATMCATLESTAQGYANAFDFWFAQVDMFGLDVLTFRHEHMIGDVEGHARLLCEFLGLDWSPGMVAFHEHARQRGYIRTPSYHQVVEPVNRKGVGRWQRYGRWMEPALPHLAPYLKRFGYDD